MSRKHRLSHDRKVLLLAVLAGAPASMLVLGWLWLTPHETLNRVVATLVLAGAWLGFARGAQNAVVRPLQTVSNLLSAMREEDFSFRARGSRDEDAMSQVMVEVNALAETLRQQRLGALEATALLKKVMEEIDVAVFAFDAGARLRLTNRTGERLLGAPGERLVGLDAASLGLDVALTGDVPRVIEAAFGGTTARYEVRRSTIRQGGLPQQLVVLTNVSRALREEERQAWQRLIRVLGHELNNSLAPIRSIAGSLEPIAARWPAPPDAVEDMKRGLAVIASRAEALGRFTAGYSKLARLPPPQIGRVSVRELVERAARLESRLEVAVVLGPNVTIPGDADQLEQLLINLVRNAADAAHETGGGVRIGWLERGGAVEITVEDDGPGLPSPANLFVPFFTTKPGGSGIGLVLSRQIAEAHGGTLTLENRPDGRGCHARLRLPAR